jgi:deoxyribodipyrimidine photolyase-related protein
MNEPLIPAHTVRLILGDQLNPTHGWFATCHPDVVYLMMEVRQETDYVLHHAQKVIAIFAAMRDFARNLQAAGHRVHYIAITSPEASNRMADNISQVMRHYQASHFAYQEPDEWRVDDCLQTYCAEAEASGQHHSRMVSSEHFYTARLEARSLFKPGKHWLMETLYRQLRTRHRVLLDEAGKPAGGRWNFDADNRKAWKGIPAEPRDFRPLHDHSRLWADIQAAGVQTLGQASAENFRWPLNRTEALAQVEDFVTDALPHFGDFQDALSRKADRLFHSLLSFALNTKMLSPREVVNRVETAWREGGIPLAAAEGFIRQILGWREYVRGVYWTQMPGYENNNFLANHNPLPDWFWTGETQMACVRSAIRQSLEQAYAHHIQRLMVIGNFAVLAGVNPAALHRWYLGIYIDAFEWVELPNTLGMSQYADGGGLATKPYVSSAAYLDRMGDYCRTCNYDIKLKTGPTACPFNALYWAFYERHKDRLSHNARIGMAYQQLSKMDPALKQSLLAHADYLRSNLNSL